LIDANKDERKMCCILQVVATSMPYCVANNRIELAPLGCEAIYSTHNSFLDHISSAEWIGDN